MRYVVMGADGQLGGRVAENMLETVDGRDLMFTAPDLSRIPAEKLALEGEGRHRGSGQL